MNIFAFFIKCGFFIILLFLHILSMLFLTKIIHIFFKCHFNTIYFKANLKTYS